jgi:hypothetical protein
MHYRASALNQSRLTIGRGQIWAQVTPWPPADSVRPESTTATLPLHPGMGHHQAAVFGWNGWIDRIPNRPSRDALARPDDDR